MQLVVVEYVEVTREGGFIVPMNEYLCATQRTAKSKMKMFRKVLTTLSRLYKIGVPHLTLATHRLWIEEDSTTRR